MAIKIDNPMTIVQSGSSDLTITCGGNVQSKAAKLANASFSCSSLTINSTTALALSNGLLNGTVNTNTINIVLQTPPTNINSLFRELNSSSSTIDTINISGDLSQVTNYKSVLYQANVENVTGTPFDFSSVVTDSGVATMFDYNRWLKEIRFKPNTVSVNFVASSTGNTLSNASDATIVSLVNSLNESVSKTFSSIAPLSTRLSTITGTVSLDSTSTYHIFTQDSTGSTTLADFITNTKGWTLA